MTDRYLFRGKRKDNGEWVVDNSVLFFKNATKIYGALNEWREVEVISETVGQYTGLKDKNGERIFEGDICKHRSNCSGNTVISVVTYTDGHFLALVCENSGFELSEKLEVIGNIHDNPELLRGDTE